jgi:integrase
MIDLDRGEKACPLDTEPDAVLQLIVGYRLVAVRQVHRDDRDEQHETQVVTMSRC